jgi:PTH1 family peptidyl-tRNA hydrolase
MFRKKVEAVHPEWMFVGLGNPGPQYSGTRHNVGFEVIDRLASRHRLKITTGKQQALIGLGRIDSTAVALVKPLTFMNLSGRSVAPLAKAWGIPPERIVVIADDLDLEVGRVRMKPKGGSGGHNGHKSIIEHLASQEYPRIKIGIGKGSSDTIEHVLDKFHPDERPDINRAVDFAVEGCERILRDGAERALTFLNEGQS